MERTINGQTIQFVAGSPAIIEEVVDQDVYRFMRWVKRCSPGGVVDLGANAGAFTLMAAAYGCTVIAVEPDPTVFEMLTANCQANPTLNKQVWLVQKAVGATEATRWLHSSNTASGGILYPREGFPPVQVATVTLHKLIDMADELHALHGLGFLKMDIEGAEAEVFGASLSTIFRFEAVAMEWHNYDGLLYKRLLSDEFDDVELVGGGEVPYDPTIGGGLLRATRSE